MARTTTTTWPGTAGPDRPDRPRRLRRPDHPGRRGRAALAGVAALCTAGAFAVAAPAAGASTAAAGGFREVKLVSDLPGTAQLVDPDVKNPWGIAFGPTTPLWVANAGTGTATIYAGANGTAPVAKVPLTVKVPAGSTGQVFNSLATTNPNAFFVHTGGTGGPAAFLFNSLGGDVAAWHGSSPPGLSSTTQVTVPRSAYTGLAIASVGGKARLFGANAASGSVDVFDGSFHKVGSIVDPGLPHLAPYNVAVLGTKLYVSYASQEAPSAGPRAAVDVYDLDGSHRHRLITGGVLDGPWGMVIAPAGWGAFGGDLLVGNEEGGQVHAFDPTSGALRGTLRLPSGKPFARDGLWGLAFGNGTFGRPTDLIYAAGIDGYAHGLIGTLTPQ